MHLFQPQYWTMHDGKKEFRLPYSVGCIWSYIAQFPEVKHHWQLTGLHYWREPIPSVLEKMQDPDICGFSCYVWNEQYCIKLAEQIKQRWPGCLIVIGGPQASVKYLAYPFVDHIIMAEGEEAMLDLVQKHDQNVAPPVLYKKQRLSNLDIPSPYLTGVFDNIMAEVSSDAMWHAMMETNRGCPYACTFCDWGGTTYSKIKTFELEKVEQELAWMASRNVNVVYLADANFGILKDRDWQIANSIKNLLENSKVDYVGLTYAKFCNEHIFKIAKVLGDLSKGITLSMQSMNPVTLKAIKRDNLAINDLKTMLMLSEKYDVPTYTEMILGLPLETLESWKTGLCELMEIGQHNMVEIYPASILENAELNSQRLMYGIHTTKVPDYMLGSYHEISEDDKIVEQNEIVVSTSTMDVEDMHKAWMYSWTVLQWHYGGYSQILARYLNALHEVSYRKFYDRIFEGLPSQKDSVGALYRQVLDTYDGSITNRPIQAMHHIISRYLDESLKIKQCMIDYAIEIAKQFTALDKDVIELQNNFVIDLDIDHEKIYHSSFDPTTWLRQAVRYKLAYKSEKVAQNLQNLAYARRRGWHTHRIDILTN